MATLLLAAFAFLNGTDVDSTESPLAKVESSAFPTFSEWMNTHGRTYAGLTELMYRRDVYEANLNKIDAHNSGEHTWKMGVNKFADLTADEFKARFTGGYSGAKKHSKKTHGNFKQRVSTKDLPAGIDWRTEGAVTPVKNQQQCGSCWSFSTTGAIEGAWAITRGQLTSLSEQQLIDCSSAEGNQGCNGGMMDYAFQYVIQNGGLTTESNYPYTATGPNNCSAAGKAIAATISGYTDVPPNSDAALMAAVAKQPVSVAIEADQASFQFYTSGVMTAACGTNLDHGVLVVGYNSAAWIVKNSWGPDWGDSGYIQLARGDAYDPAGQCGILSDPSYPTV
jgi:C1A family cysteine protease